MWWRAPTRLHLMSCNQLPINPAIPVTVPANPDRTSGCTTRNGTYPIDHHVAELHQFEHQDKAGHPRVTPSDIPNKEQTVN